MAGMKLLAAFGMLCLVATASAQTSTLTSLLSNTLEAGSYLVNGTGVVYDENSITLIAGGQVIQTLPRNAMAPGPAQPFMHDMHDMHDDKTKDMKNPQPTTQPTASSPAASPTDTASMDKGLSKEDPLDKVVIGRKMM